MNAPADEVLVQRAVGGDREALATLTERHGPQVRQRLAGSIPMRWQSVLSVDDVMQQAYTDALLGIGRFESRGEGSFTAWLATLAKHNLLNAIKMLETDKRGGDRRRIEAPVAVNEESYVSLFELLGGDSTTPSREVAMTEARRALEGALQKLPAVYREVVERYDLQGLPVEALAEELGRSPGAIYMLRARAHRMLAELMGTISKYLSFST